MAQSAASLSSRLAGTRTRFQRVRDARQFVGWVQQFDSRGFVVMADDAISILPGDECVFEVYGKKYSFYFSGKLEAANEKYLVFDINDDMRLSPANQSVRISVADYPCTLTTVDSAAVGRVVDVGPEGAGVLLGIEIARSQKVDMEIDVPAGVVRCHGEVRYCRNTKQSGYPFRIGLLLSFPDRVGLARWIRQFDEVA